MGWRVSFYRANKENPVTVEHIVDGEMKYDTATINDEKEVLYDQGTDIWIELKTNNEDFKKEIKCLADNPDEDYYSITKDGFKMIILAYRDRIIENLKKQIEVHKNPELKESREYRWYDGNVLRSMEEELHIWEWSYPSDDGDRRYENICLHKSKDEFGISSSWQYKYAIFDMIEVYKYFDWDNYTMVVYGG
jgi:hypothetical protein